jgi:hypothetical protein
MLSVVWFTTMLLPALCLFGCLMLREVMIGRCGGRRTSVWWLLSRLGGLSLVRRGVWAHGPGKRDIAHGLPGDAGMIKFHFPAGVAAYSELVRKPGLSAFVVIDLASCRFLHVTFRHGLEPV